MGEALADWHHAQHEHNSSFAAHTDRAVYPDWVITGCFYAALHLVQQALIDEFGTGPRKHEERNLWVFKCTRTKGVAQAYLDLKALSEHVRYNVAHTDVGDDQVSEAADLLAEIESGLGLAVSQ